ncbi:hypothetical protein LZ637_16215, partial [Shewanella algae]|nr:hypothetical protein [Shewanella algae]
LGNKALDSNKEWLFSGAGVALAAIILSHFKRDKKTPPSPSNKLLEKEPISIEVHVDNSNKNSINNSTKPENPQETLPEKENQKIKDEAYYKNNTKILIIDDETKFKLPKILKS